MTDADEILTSQRFSARPMLSIDTADLRRLLEERARLREQRDELQAGMTRLLLERRQVDWTAQVRALFVAFGQEMPTRVGFPDTATMKLRLGMMSEEHEETIAAYLAGDFPGYVDGCIDLMVVTLGALVACGVDPVPAWDAVQSANLTKSTGPISPEGKRLKPPGFVPPDIAGILVAQGWTPPKEAA